MQGENKKTKSGGSKGENEKRSPGRIDEYKFFLAQDEEDSEDKVSEVKTKIKSRKKKNGLSGSMNFFLSE